MPAGQYHESVSFEALKGTVALRGTRGRSRRDAVAEDKGYSYQRIRRWLRRRGIEAVILAGTLKSAP